MDTELAQGAQLYVRMQGGQIVLLEPKGQGRAGWTKKERVFKI